MNLNQMITPASEEIVQVVVARLTRGFRYTAVFADGSTQVIRAKATRLYTFAFRYEWDNMNRSCLRDQFSFSTRNRPLPYPHLRVVGVYTITPDESGAHHLEVI